MAAQSRDRISGRPDDGRGTSPPPLPSSPPEHQTPLNTAAQHGHEGAVCLLAGHADANRADVNGAMPLHFAAAQGMLRACQSLCAGGVMYRGANVDVARDHGSGDTALLAASRNGHLGVVRLLLHKRADVNLSRRADGTSPLYAASEAGNLAIVRQLLAKGADVTAERFDCTTPVSAASHNGHNDVVRELLRFSAESMDTPLPDVERTQSSRQLRSRPHQHARQQATPYGGVAKRSATVSPASRSGGGTGMRSMCTAAETRAQKLLRNGNNHHRNEQEGGGKSGKKRGVTRGRDVRALRSALDDLYCEQEYVSPAKKKQDMMALLARNEARGRTGAGHGGSSSSGTHAQSRSRLPQIIPP